MGLIVDPRHSIGLAAAALALAGCARMSPVAAPGLDKAAVLEALEGGKALGAASLVLRFNH